MWLFDTTGFVPRAHCGVGWDGWLVAVSVTGNLLIFLAYVGIPVVLLRGRRKFGHLTDVTGLTPMWVPLAFAAFILCCGVGHLWYAATFLYPCHRAFALWDLVTGLVSWTTLVGIVVAMREIGPKVVALAADRDEALRRVGELELSLSRVVSEMRAHGYDPPEVPE